MKDDSRKRSRACGTLLERTDMHVNVKNWLQHYYDIQEEEWSFERRRLQCTYSTADWTDMELLTQQKVSSDCWGDRCFLAPHPLPTRKNYRATVDMERWLALGDLDTHLDFEHVPGMQVRQSRIWRETTTQILKNTRGICKTSDNWLKLTEMNYTSTLPRTIRLTITIRNTRETEFYSI